MDVGQRTVDYIYQRLQIDAEWSVRHDRGFTWWGCGLAQHIWAEPCFDDDGIVLSRIHVRTDLLQGLPNTDAALSELVLQHADCVTLSGMIRDPDDPSRVQLASTTYIHEGVEEWLKWTLAWIALMQVAEANLVAETLATNLGCKPAFSSHPTSGKREDVDELVNISIVTIPLGMQPSQWAGQEMLKALGLFQHNPMCVMANGEGSSLAAEFPYGSQTSLIRMMTQENHPVVGNGLQYQFSLPNQGSRAICPADAIRMNEREVRSFNQARFFGSWRIAGSFLTYQSFYPNALYRPGMLFDIAMSAALRARWISEDVMGERFDTKPLSAMERFFRRLKGQ